LSIQKNLLILLKAGDILLNEIFVNLKPILVPLSCLILAFLAGGMVAGLFFYRSRPDDIGKLDSRYNIEHRRAAEIIGRLEEELGRERELNRRLREHNNRARKLAEGITDTSERNVRNLQDAVSLIGEIRTKLAILADFYADSNTGNSNN